jgi:hypothetical protein
MPAGFGNFSRSSPSRPGHVAVTTAESGDGALRPGPSAPSVPGPAGGVKRSTSSREGLMSSRSASGRKPSPYLRRSRIDRHARLGPVAGRVIGDRDIPATNDAAFRRQFTTYLVQMQRVANSRSRLTTAPRHAHGAIPRRTSRSRPTWRWRRTSSSRLSPATCFRSLSGSSPLSSGRFRKASCAASSTSNIASACDDADHQSLVSQNLDVKVSTRATQTSPDTLTRTSIRSTRPSTASTRWSTRGWTWPSRRAHRRRAWTRSSRR